MLHTQLTMGVSLYMYSCRVNTDIVWGVTDKLQFILLLFSLSLSFSHIHIHIYQLHDTFTPLPDPMSPGIRLARGTSFV